MAARQAMVELAAAAESPVVAAVVVRVAVADPRWCHCLDSER